MRINVVLHFQLEVWREGGKSYSKKKKKKRRRRKKRKRKNWPCIESECVVLKLISCLYEKSSSVTVFIWRRIFNVLQTCGCLTAVFFLFFFFSSGTRHIHSVAIQTRTAVMLCCIYGIYIKHNKVQACLGIENVYSKFSPVLGLFQGLPCRLDGFLPIIYIYISKKNKLPYKFPNFRLTPSSGVYS